MYIKRKLFPKGTKLGDNDDSVPSSSGSSKFNADLDVFLPANPADPTSQLLHYKFLFWNVFGTLTTKSKVVSETPSGPNKDAAAWYGLVGGGDGEGIITTYAFSPEQDTVVDDTPIASVTPQGAWKGGNSNTVSPSAGGNDKRVIKALSSVPHIISSVFLNWFPLGPGTPENDTRTLNVDHGVSTLALAQYKSHVDIVRGGIKDPGNPDKTTKPGPISIDRTKLVDLLTQAQTHPASDRLRQQVLKKEQSPVMADDLLGVAVELNADINRLQAAIDLINAGLEGKVKP